MLVSDDQVIERNLALENGHFVRNEETFSALAANEEDHFHWQAEKVARIIKLLQELKVTGRLADVGCFTGKATELFRAAGFDQAVGFDASRDTFPYLLRRGIEPRHWVAGSTDCPAGDREFDVVIAADVIEHIIDTDAFVKELYRILRSEGWLIVTTPNLAFWLSRFRLLLGKLPWSYPGASPTIRVDIKVDLNHIRLSTRTEWEALFKSQGFTVVDVMGWSLLQAIKGGISVQLRQTVDRVLTRFPEMAFGLLLLLRK